jgi:hypothetical protein
MATVTHESPHVGGRNRWSQVAVREAWTSLAITVIWISVTLDALFGPNIVTTSIAGDTAVIPSAVVMAFFAVFATWIVAKYGFRRDGTD